MLIVMKFGGTSVGSPEALEKVVEIVKNKREEGHQVVVVVSAMSGVTNMLLEAAHKAEAGDEETAYNVRLELTQKHTDVTRHFLSQSPERETVMAKISALLDDFETWCHSVRILGELTPRTLEVVGGLGERMSIILVSALLNQAGVPAQDVSATELIVTDRRFGAAVPLIQATEAKTQAILHPILEEEDQTPVVTGFIAATQDGIQTTLGRGGSDYSATILGRALKADEVWVWTDVNGVMSADPRIVPEARTIRHLTYAEISELSYFGARVLHSQAIRPARRASIPVRILNTFEPDHPGTLITGEAKPSDKTVKALTAIKDMSLITVAGPGMIGIPGIAGRVFTAVARADTSILMISQSSSEQAICFVIPSRDVVKVAKSLEDELALEISRRDIDGVRWEDSRVILAAVGDGMKGTPGVSGRLFGALGREKINVIAIAQGSSEYNISIVVEQEQADRAVQMIHKEFGLDKPSS